MAGYSQKFKKRRKVIRMILWILLLLLIFLLFAVTITWVINADEKSIKKILGLEITNTPTPGPTDTPVPTAKPTDTPTPIPIKGKVIVDPGHGGTDSGSKSEDGTIAEKTITLEIALLLQEQLEKNGYIVSMTRYDDLTSLTNAERAYSANSKDAALLISLHMNTYPADKMVNGLEVLYDSGRDDSKKLATALVNPICNSCGAKNRGIKPRNNMTILKDVNVPSVDIEMGFMTCKEELDKIMDASYRELLVKGICDGLDVYFESVK